MAMTTLMPTGQQLTEFFKDEISLEKRRKVLESAGGVVQRVLQLHCNPRYPTPHQGKGEIARRLRQMQRQEAKAAK